MRGADERVQEASCAPQRAGVSEVATDRREEWEQLLEILRSADSPVGAAVQWVESHRYGTAFDAYGKHEMGGKRRRVCELWRLVPDLLASEIVYVEEEEETQRKGTMGSGIWMQTLPSAVQADVLTFLNVEHLRFRVRDLEALARWILDSPTEPEFWVFQAATTLLKTALSKIGSPLSSSSQVAGSRTSPPSCDLHSINSSDKEIFGAGGASTLEYNDLPDWLDDYREQPSSLFGWLPLKHSPSTQAAEQVQGTSLDVEKSEPLQSSDRIVKLEAYPGKSGAFSNVEVSLVDGCEFDKREAVLCRSLREEPTTKEIGIQKSDKIKIGEENLDCLETRAEMSKEQDNSDTDDERTAKLELGEEIFLQALSLRRALVSREEPSLPDAVNLIRTTSNLTTFLSVVRAWEVDDDVTLLLVGNLLAEQDGYSWSTQILRAIILPKLIALERPASRVLITALILAGKTHPRATMDSVILPLISSKEGASNIQCEVINRLVKDCIPEDILLSLIQKMFVMMGERSYDPSLRVAWIWTEGMVGVVQNLVNKKLNLDQQTIAGLVLALEGAVTEFPSSLKFGNLLLSLVTKYGGNLSSHRAVLQEVVSKTQTFLTKSVQSKLSSF